MILDLRATRAYVFLLKYRITCLIRQQIWQLRKPLIHTAALAVILAVSHTSLGPPPWRGDGSFSEKEPSMKPEKNPEGRVVSG